MADLRRPYDLESARPFSRGRRVTIEASAGTGKTYALTATVARLVAEHDLQANQLLLMTFTNEATEELRQVTRSRCQAALAFLQGRGSAEPWMKQLAPDESDERPVQISRLATFLTRYDEVTITTIHGFCQMVLKRSGLSSLAPPNFDLLPKIDHIIDQTITDLVAAKLAVTPGLLSVQLGADGLPKNEAKSTDIRRALSAVRDAVKAALNNDGAVLLPAPLGSRLANDPDVFAQVVKKQTASARAATDLAQVVADEIRAIIVEVRLRCEKQGVVTYNDLIRLVRTSLDVRTEAGARLAKQLADQYPIVMVDEFQDTDASQAAIFDAIFEMGAGTTTLFTVGDPKQAIYRFRGADVNVYLNERNKAHETYELATNWRSDPPMLRAIKALLGNVRFDMAGTVPFATVHAPASKSPDWNGLSFPAEDPIDSAAFELRYIPKHIDYGADEKSLNLKGPVEDHIQRDLAKRVKQLLSTSSIAASDGTHRPLSPSDVAILVHAHHQAASVVRALEAEGIPAVRLKTGSVFETEAARHWNMFLKGIARPASPTAVRTFALSWFGGMTEDELLVAGDSRMAELQRDCVDAAEQLLRDGVTAVYLSFRSREHFLARVLADNAGLRNLTDLDHIAEVLESHPDLVGGAGPTETLAVIAALIDEKSEDAENEQRRIESDLQGVKVMTIYASKGLEFPVVCLPTLMHVPKSGSPNMFPARLEVGRPSVRAIDVASGVKAASKWRFTPSEPHGDDVDFLLAASSEEKKVVVRGRDLQTSLDVEADHRRLMYVALTRAKHKVIAYWSPINSKIAHDPFAHALQASLASTTAPVTADELRRLTDTLSDGTGGAVVGVDISELYLEVDDVDDARTLGMGDSSEIAEFSRLEAPVSIHGYGRWSYSSIVSRMKARAGRDAVGSSITKMATTEELPGVTDEANEEITDSFVVNDAGPWEGLPAGAGFGDAVHRVLDRIDPGAQELTAEVTAAVTEIFAPWPASLDRDRLVTSLVTSVTTPLDGVYGDFSLAELGSTHRLSELRFDFPLRADDATSVDSIIAALVEDPNLPDAARERFDAMIAEGSTDLQIAGFMTGSIDAVFRIPTDPPRFIVCDYKTNLLHPHTAVRWHDYYDQPHLVAAMVKDGYYFQAVVYAVALHRFLRQRLPNYSFATHFGGVSYLFLRGLTGTRDSTGALHGSYIWTPSEDLVRRVDELLSEELV